MNNKHNSHNATKQKFSTPARQQPFIVGVYTAQTAMPGATGFNLDYTQVTN